MVGDPLNNITTAHIVKSQPILVNYIKFAYQPFFPNSACKNIYPTIAYRILETKSNNVYEKFIKKKQGWCEHTPEEEQLSQSPQKQKLL